MAKKTNNMHNVTEIPVKQNFLTDLFTTHGRVVKITDFPSDNNYMMFEFQSGAKFKALTKDIINCSNENQRIN